MEWLKKHSAEEAFLSIHLMDPHLPYNPKPENAGCFGPADYSGPYEKEFDIIPRDIEAMRAGEIAVAEDDKKRIEALYDEEILGCDEDFAAFLKQLDAQGYLENSLIIITADHGEEFWEHGGYEHGHQLYDEVLHVPLIIHGVGFPAGKRFDGLCSNFDLFPTIHEWLGLEPPGEINAVSLYDLMEGRIEPESRYLLSEQLCYGIEQKGITTDRYRYIFHTFDGSEELYDCSDDPGMLSDVASDRRSMARQYRYLVKGFTLNSMSGWHIRYSRNPSIQGGKLLEIEITAPGGFTDITSHGLEEGDDVENKGDSLLVELHIDSAGEKAVGFSTPHEDTEVHFDIKIDSMGDRTDMVFLGPAKEPYHHSQFSMKITDERFGLGIPNFRKAADPGVFIWGNSLSLQEELSPEIDDRVREELKSLGYLQ
jgi:hypothetical protein